MLFLVNHSPPVLRDTREHFSIRLGGQFKQQNHSQKAQKCEKCGTKAAKRMLVFSMRTETRRQSTA